MLPWPPSPSTSRQIVILLRQWERLAAHVPRDADAVRWIAEHTWFPSELVAFVRHCRNQCAHGKLPRVDDLRRAVATAGALLQVADRLADQGIAPPSEIRWRCRGTVGVGCGFCGTLNWLPSLPSSTDDPPSCSDCGELLIIATTSGGDLPRPPVPAAR